ncbi:hypothetical protein ACQY0O_000865 [Thecaphora frezii]
MASTSDLPNTAKEARAKLLSHVATFATDASKKQPSKRQASPQISPLDDATQDLVGSRGSSRREEICEGGQRRGWGMENAEVSLSVAREVFLTMTVPYLCPSTARCQVKRVSQNYLSEDRAKRIEASLEEHLPAWRDRDPDAFFRFVVLLDNYLWLNVATKEHDETASPGTASRKAKLQQQLLGFSERMFLILRAGLRRSAAEKLEKTLDGIRDIFLPFWVHLLCRIRPQPLKPLRKALIIARLRDAVSASSRARRSLSKLLRPRQLGAWLGQSTEFAASLDLLELAQYWSKEVKPDDRSSFYDSIFAAALQQQSPMSDPQPPPLDASKLMLARELSQKASSTTPATFDAISEEVLATLGEAELFRPQMFACPVEPSRKRGPEWLVLREQPPGSQSFHLWFSSTKLSFDVRDTFEIQKLVKEQRGQAAESLDRKIASIECCDCVVAYDQIEDVAVDGLTGECDFTTKQDIMVQESDGRHPDSVLGNELGVKFDTHRLVRFAEVLSHRGVGIRWRGGRSQAPIKVNAPDRHASHVGNSTAPSDLERGNMRLPSATEDGPLRSGDRDGTERTRDRADSNANRLAPLRHPTESAIEGSGPEAQRDPDRSDGQGQAVSRRTSDRFSDLMEQYIEYGDSEPGSSGKGGAPDPVMRRGGTTGSASGEDRNGAAIPVVKLGQHTLELTELPQPHSSPASNAPSSGSIDGGSEGLRGSPRLIQRASSPSQGPSRSPSANVQPTRNALPRSKGRAAKRSRSESGEHATETAAAPESAASKQRGVARSGVEVSGKSCETSLCIFLQRLRNRMHAHGFGRHRNLAGTKTKKRNTKASKATIASQNAAAARKRASPAAGRPVLDEPRPAGPKDRAQVKARRKAIGATRSDAAAVSDSATAAYSRSVEHSVASSSPRKRAVPEHDADPASVSDPTAKVGALAGRISRRHDSPNEVDLEKDSTDLFRDHEDPSKRPRDDVTWAPEAGSTERQESTELAKAGPADEDNPQQTSAATAKPTSVPDAPIAGSVAAHKQERKTRGIHRSGGAVAGPKSDEAPWMTDRHRRSIVQRSRGGEPESSPRKGQGGPVAAGNEATAAVGQESFGSTDFDATAGIEDSDDLEYVDEPEAGAARRGPTSAPEEGEGAPGGPPLQRPDALASAAPMTRQKGRSPVPDRGEPVPSELPAPSPRGEPSQGRRTSSIGAPTSPLDRARARRQGAKQAEAAAARELDDESLPHDSLTAAQLAAFDHSAAIAPPHTVRGPIWEDADGDAVSDMLEFYEFRAFQERKRKARDSLTARLTADPSSYRDDGVVRFGVSPPSNITPQPHGVVPMAAGTASAESGTARTRREDRTRNLASTRAAAAGLSTSGARTEPSSGSGKEQSSGHGALRERSKPWIDNPLGGGGEEPAPRPFTTTSSVQGARAREAVARAEAGRRSLFHALREDAVGRAEEERATVSMQKIQRGGASILELLQESMERKRSGPMDVLRHLRGQMFLDASAAMREIHGESVAAKSVVEGLNSSLRYTTAALTKALVSAPATRGRNMGGHDEVPAPEWLGRLGDQATDLVKRVRKQTLPDRMFA